MSCDNSQNNKPQSNNNAPQLTEQQSAYIRKSSIGCMVLLIVNVLLSVATALLAIYARLYVAALYIAVPLAVAVLVLITICIIKVRRLWLYIKRL